MNNIIQEQKPAIKNEGWWTYADKTCSSRTIVTFFNEKEITSKYNEEDDLRQESNELRSEAKIRFDGNYDNYGYHQFIEVELSLTWWFHCRWINRRLDKVQSDGYRNLTILDTCRTKIPYTKENKAKLKVKIKRYLDKQVERHLNEYFNEKYITDKQPNEVEFIKMEDQHKKNLTELMEI